MTKKILTYAISLVIAVVIIFGLGFFVKLFWNLAVVNMFGANEISLLTATAFVALIVILNQLFKCDENKKKSEAEIVIEQIEKLKNK